MKKTVVVGITSGIAAFKALDLIKTLRNEHVEVFVIMTKHATQMISPKKFERASGNKVYIELFSKGFDYESVLKKRKVEHIELADTADVLVIVPATANIIAKLAYGMADDFLTTTALATTAPVLICPSMNVHMWNNPSVQENVKRLQSQGFQIVEPVSGMLACGYEGKGRLEEIELIKNQIVQQLAYTQSLQGKKIIVTAGGTIDTVDAVRYITNRSSGKMGIAIAEECHRRGAEVLLVRSKYSVAPRYTIHEKIFTTSENLLEIIKKNVKKTDIFYHVAAVSDFKVLNPTKGKKTSKKTVTIRLKPRKKILNQIKKYNPSIVLISFKAGYALKNKGLLSAARKKLQESKSDFVVANDISKKNTGFESEYNEVFVISSNGNTQKIPLSLKKEIAKKVVDLTSVQATHQV